ncbi:MAG TPA: GNAT family N-acetyltransferase [Actinomycetota bacterium]|nr:GNAT family N-acetyltransferase [Actinomycetota bacterium]
MTTGAMPTRGLAEAGRLHLRRGTAADADACGRIFWEAFASVASRHDFPAEPVTSQFAAMMAPLWLGQAGIDCVVAEAEGALVGCAFSDRRDPVIGIGPVCVAPQAQDAGIGRAMMQWLLHGYIQEGAAAVRLVQTAYHYRSLALYAKLGFVVREPLSVVSGSPLGVVIPGRSVRPASADDLPVCNAICSSVHGHDRGAELGEAAGMGMAVVVEKAGEVTGYATGFGYGFHAVGRENADLMALIGSAPSILGLGILVPSRNAELLRWCLGNGLHIVQQSTLMTIGHYQEPAGAWLPSIRY